MKCDIRLLRNKAIGFMYSKWAEDCFGNEELDIDTENFEKISDYIFNELTANKKSSKSPFMFRTGGQSGSGKTTQLMPSINHIIEKNGLDFINISVRTFSKLHPKYDELLAEFGAGMIREKTNGFALLMLFRTLERLINNKYNILLEVTLLDNYFEKYLFKLAKTKRYNVHFHILSVPREKSDSWIEKRKMVSKTEGNRVVLKSSSNFFFDILPIALGKIVFYKFWNKNDKIFLWNGFDLKPVLIGKVKNNKNFLEIFAKYRAITDFEEIDESKLLNSKIKWFSEYYG